MYFLKCYWAFHHLEVEFTLDVTPSIEPISTTFYQMAPTNLKELKTQLEHILEAGFIRPCTCMWEISVLFIKKKGMNLLFFAWIIYNSIRLQSRISINYRPVWQIKDSESIFQYRSLFWLLSAESEGNRHLQNGI